MITVFTPTYNRAYILPKLYESLCKQTCYDFEWLIVDDGSTDNTEMLIKTIQYTETKFQIRYYNQKNQGKHVAVNYGVTLAKGDWFFIVDSDDHIVSDAIETIKKWIEFEDIQSDKYAAVSGCRCNKDGYIIGDYGLKKEYVDASNLERRKYKLMGDKAEIYKTSLLNKYPFPTYDEEKFIPENVVWDAIALDGYLIRWFKKPLIVCDYLSDGLTAKGKHIDFILNNFRGYENTVLIDSNAFYGIDLIRLQSEYTYYCLKKNKKISYISRKINKPTIVVIIYYCMWLLNITLKNVKEHLYKGDK